jgi:hypothetical protein
VPLAVTPSPAPALGAPPPDARVAELEARCAQLRQDVDHLALFARTLLALLEEKGVATEEHFQEVLRKLDTKPAAPPS